MCVGVVNETNVNHNVMSYLHMSFSSSVTPDDMETYSAICGRWETAWRWKLVMFGQLHVQVP